MGVDYTGNYGIGVQVYLPDFEEDHEWYDDRLGYLEDVLENAPYSYFEVGEGNYTGEDDDIYICIDKPFENGYDITEKVNSLLEFLENTELTVIGKVDEVGGLRIW